MSQPNALPPKPAPAPDDSIPGVPGFSTWRGVYLFVFSVFVLVVVGLALLSRFFA